MKIKKHNIFLWSSLAFFAFSLIVVVISIISSYYQIKTDFPNDPRRVSDEFGWLIIYCIFFIFPVFAVEFTCIRSIYKILKYEPKGIVKICYIISALLALAAFIFQCLMFSGAISFIDDSGSSKLQQRMLFLTEWPIFIISFILGSIKKYNSECDAV